MRAVILLGFALCFLFWWGVWTHTLEAFAIYGAAIAVLSVAAKVWPYIERRIELRRAQRDPNGAWWVN